MENYETLLKELNDITDEDLVLKMRIPDRTNIITILKQVQAVILPDYYHAGMLNQQQALNYLSEGLQRLLCNLRVQIVPYVDISEICSCRNYLQSNALS